MDSLRLRCDSLHSQLTTTQATHTATAATERTKWEQQLYAVRTELATHTHTLSALESHSRTALASVAEQIQAVEEEVSHRCKEEWEGKVKVWCERLQNVMESDGAEVPTAAAESNGSSSAQQRLTQTIEAVNQRMLYHREQLQALSASVAAATIAAAEAKEAAAKAQAAVLDAATATATPTPSHRSLQSSGGGGSAAEIWARRMAQTTTTTTNVNGSDEVVMSESQVLSEQLQSVQKELEAERKECVRWKEQVKEWQQKVMIATTELKEEKEKQQKQQQQLTPPTITVNRSGSESESGAVVSAEWSEAFVQMQQTALQMANAELSPLMQAFW